MQFRRLGASGLRVPVFSLGGWLTFGGTVKGDPVKEIVKTAFENGELLSRQGGTQSERAVFARNQYDRFGRGVCQWRKRTGDVRTRYRLPILVCLNYVFSSGRVVEELGIRRSDLILTGKIFFGVGRKGPNDRGLSRKQ
jgi:hypothetical protein